MENIILMSISEDKLREVISSEVKNCFIEKENEVLFDNPIGSKKFMDLFGICPATYNNWKKKKIIKVDKNGKLDVIYLGKIKEQAKNSNIIEHRKIIQRIKELGH